MTARCDEIVKAFREQSTYQAPRLRHVLAKKDNGFLTHRDFAVSTQIHDTLKWRSCDGEGQELLGLRALKGQNGNILGMLVDPTR